MMVKLARCWILRKIGQKYINTVNMAAMLSHLFWMTTNGSWKSGIQFGLVAEAQMAYSGLIFGIISCNALYYNEGMV